VWIRGCRRGGVEKGEGIVFYLFEFTMPAYGKDVCSACSQWWMGCSGRGVEEGL